MDRRDQLIDLRDRLSALLAGADERTAPALSRELRAVMAELEQLPDESKKATVDELKERRASRQAEAKDRTRSSGDR
jgi:hypothetical protein